MVCIRIGRRLQEDTSGNVLLLTALSMTVLVGAAGLGTDTIQWITWQRQLQREADSGAIAAAIANYQGKSASDAANVAINRYSLVTLSSSPTVEVGPISGAYAGDTNAVRVTLQTKRKLPFSSFFMSTPPTILTQATAKAVSYGDYCVVSLENTTATGITLQGNASVDLGCGMATNSQGSTAVYASGSSYVSASPVAAVGLIPLSNNFASGTVIQANSMAQADPFANLPTPSLSSCANQLTVAPNQTASISNPTGVACYSGMNIKGTVTFDPGIYFIDAAAMKIGSQAQISGNGVVFILTSTTAASNPSSIATLEIDGGATVDLTAPTSGTYAGVLFYQDRRALSGSTNFVTGNSSSTLQGSIYFPTQDVQFTGNSGMNTNCVRIVSRTVTFIGNNNISNVCPANSGTPDMTGVRIRLVG